MKNDPIESTHSDFQPNAAHSVDSGKEEAYFAKNEEGNSLLQKEELFPLLLNNLSDGVALFENNTLIFASPAYKKILGYDDLSNFRKLTDIFTYIHPDDLEQVKKEVENAQKNKIETHKYSFRFKRKDGEYCWIENSTKRKYNEAGENHRIFVTGRDITERKKTEGELRDIKEKLELALSKAKMGIWEWYIETNMVNWYGSHATLFGISNKDFGGTLDDVQKIIHPEDRFRGLEAFEKTVSQGTEFKNTYRVIWPDKSIHWLFSNGNLIYSSDGKPIKVVGITQDITSDKLLKDRMVSQNHLLVDLNSTKDKLFSIITHDLVNPLNSLLGFAQLMDLSYLRNPNEDFGRYIKMILKSAQAMADMLKTLTEWSRSQRGRINVSPKIIAPAEITNLAIDLTYASAQAKQINLINNIPKHQLAFADQEMINTVIRNIIGNAIKFSHPGSTICVDGSTNEEFFVFKISDEGIGIESSNLKNLFSISKSESQAGTSGERGTGLGLLICKEFTELNRGKIWAESIPGSGSTFYLEIPLEPKPINNP